MTLKIAIAENATKNLLTLHMSVLFSDSVGQLPYRSKNFDKTLKSFFEGCHFEIWNVIYSYQMKESNFFPPIHFTQKEIQPMQWRKIWNFFQHSSILSFSEVHIFFVMVYAKNSKDLTKTFETVTMSKYRYIMYYAAPISKNKGGWKWFFQQ